MTRFRFLSVLSERSSAAGLQLGSGAEELLWRYVSLLSKWNERVNLTALPLADYPPATIDRLLIEPMIAGDLVQPHARWFDVGSGGGSPAVPLKIFRPGTLLSMVESRAKKAAFLREVTRELNLPNTDVLDSRIEDLVPPPDSADLVTVRAVRLDAPLWRGIATLMEGDGRLLLFGWRPGSDIDARFRLERLVENAATGTNIAVLTKNS